MDTRINRARSIAMARQRDGWFESLVIYALAVGTAVMVTAVVMCSPRVAWGGETTTFRDNRGVITGYGQTRGNSTTFTAPNGQQTGRAERRPDGSTTFYNTRGQQTGTARRDGR
jgi:hypothetical protein